MTAHERQRLAALHEYRLLDAPAVDELEAVVRACRVAVAARPGESGWVVPVAGNGVGIPPEDRARVFGMFTRVDAEAGTGHGVGLSTCRRIVPRHDGRIWAGAGPDGGTTVSFTLPAA